MTSKSVILAESIDKFLTCPACSQRFVEPVILPCLQALCLKCVTGNRCAFCNKEHSSTDYKPHKLIIDLLNLRPFRIYRSKMLVSFETRYEGFKNELQSLNEHVSDIDKYIDRTCSELCKKIDDNSDLLVAKVRRQQKEFISRAYIIKNDYKCRLHNSKLQRHRLNIQNLISVADRFIKDCDAALSEDYLSARRLKRKAACLEGWQSVIKKGRNRLERLVFCPPLDLQPPRGVSPLAFSEPASPAPYLSDE